MKVNSQLERAQLENVTSLPAAATAGRVAWDTVTGKAFLDDATNWRAFLRNDQKAIIGNNGTAANNVRFHRGANGVLQLVSGADATAEGTLSTALNQISARAENYSTGSLPTFGNMGRIAYDTTTGFPKFDTGTAWKELVDSSSTQTITGKNLTGNTFDSVLFSQITTPANPSAGFNKLYTKADNKLYTLDSSGNEAQVGGGGGGGAKNLIVNGNADDTATSIFVPYADSASTRPSDGSGGSPSVTTSVSTSSPLDGSKSYLLTKPASNVQGEGWAVGFQIAPAYRAKSLKISLDYIINSGTFVSGGAGVESDIIWYIYDVTNSQLIEPSNIKMFSNSSSVADKFEATFQSSATGLDYRLIAHIGSTSALAFEIKADNITVSPQTYVYGSPVTDAKPVTATFYNVGVSSQSLFASRVGDSVRFTGKFVLSGAPTGAIQLSFAGYSFDYTKLSAANILRGTAYSEDVGVGFYTGGCEISSSDRIGMVDDDGGGRWNATTPFTWVSGDELHIDVTVPILGMSSSVQMSDSADTRVVAARYFGSTTAMIVGSVDVIQPTKHFDTHNGYNTSNGEYTIPVDGIYRVTSVWQANATTFATNQDMTLIVLINNNPQVGNLGLTVGNGVENYWMVGGSDLITCRAGDKVKIRLTSTLADSCTTNSYFAIDRISGPSAIADTEKIAASYTNSTTNIPNNTPTVAILTTKVFDTHGAYNTTTGEFTCPAAGIYDVHAMVAGAAGQIPASTANRFSYLSISKNGTIMNYGPAHHVYQSSFTANVEGIVSTKLSCNAGDKITFEVYHNLGASGTLQNTIETSFSVHRI